MAALPPPLPNATKTDLDHLRILVVMHFVVAGLALLAGAFLFLHGFMMFTVFGNPKFWAGQKGAVVPPPEAFFTMAKWFYAGFGTLLVIGMVANILSALCIRKRRWRTFSLAVAGIDCVQIPIGTALGVFTILVLVRDSVRELYEAQAKANPASSP